MTSFNNFFKRKITAYGQIFLGRYLANDTDDVYLDAPCDSWVCTLMSCVWIRLEIRVLLVSLHNTALGAVKVLLLL